VGGGGGGAWVVLVFTDDIFVGGRCDGVLAHIAHAHNAFYKFTVLYGSLFCDVTITGTWVYDALVCVCVRRCGAACGRRTPFAAAGYMRMYPVGGS
jgi:hypothetical protein